MAEETPTTMESSSGPNKPDSDAFVFKVPAPIDGLRQTKCNQPEKDSDSKSKENEQDKTCSSHKISESTQKTAQDDDKINKTNDAGTPEADHESNNSEIKPAIVMRMNSPQSNKEDSRSLEDKEYRVIFSGAEQKFHAIETNRTIDLKAEDNGPSFYKVIGPYVTQPFITGRLPKVFESLPVFGSPRTKQESESLKMRLLKDFVGGDLTNEQFFKLEMYCSHKCLRTGIELTMGSNYPLTSFATASAKTEKDLSISQASTSSDCDHFHSIKKHKLRVNRDATLLYVKRLKYRGLRFNPVGQTEDASDSVSPSTTPTASSLLVPGRDLIYRIRIYRPFPYNRKERLRTGNRHPVLVRDMVLLGRHTLEDLRDKMQCVNDVGLRIDISDQPDGEHVSSCKELFPSGFLFVNNVFYNDHRAGCFDYSATIREWAKTRGIGEFETKDMSKQRLDQLTIKLGYPEVYVHQGNCEHLFTFSEIRLVGFHDALNPNLYPTTTIHAQNHAMYCTSCAEYAASWIVTDSPRVPFDPAFFCETCFKLYMYVDGKKIGDFKAYAYKGH